MRRLTALFCLLLVGCGPTQTDLPQWYEATRPMYYGIPVTVKFFPADDAVAHKVWKYLKSVDDRFNDYRLGTEVSRLNSLPPKRYHRVSEPMWDALNLSAMVNSITEGAFDVTVGPIRQVWKQAAKEGKPPSDEAIARVIAATGMQEISLVADPSDIELIGLMPGSEELDIADVSGAASETDLGPENDQEYRDASAWVDAVPSVDRWRRNEARQVLMSEERILDFGGIIKGMAVDHVIKMLESAGVTGAFVQVGGETGVLGVSQRNMPYRLGIQHPTDETKIWTSLQASLKGMSLATSGNYRQPVMIGDQAYYHIFDPRTGRPVDTHVLSVSVLFPLTGRNGLADALTTAGAVLGPDVLPIVSELGGEALLLITDKDGAITEHRTKGWKDWERGHDGAN
ncbi:MAG TPA: hypothetical protein DCR55_02875 [Lentisphaeria bacterium]|jgi:thiamine biosynthesis lipoprotein ApbE|nr:hypothetical protein [Lentisphaeria bacterium]